ncbi:MAG: tRNA 2-selenouridine synthase [Bacteroidota bacterium]|nr:tRNA 2-selenouridine synthase [Bacteroidota bacterium]
MINQLEIEEFLKQSNDHLTIDVRSEGEFAYGHIPHATNLPLFNNEERKIVGTIYKQKGQNEAILEGLDIVGKKMADFVRFVQPKIKDNKVFVHCWRGGMRSGSMAWLFNNFGYEVGVLKGGYKSYRHNVLDWVGKDYKFIVVGGRTGSGKTEVLLKLRELSEQVIDLEGLANHKGSAFGALGQPAQPSTEHFENMMAGELKKFDLKKRVWLEDESKTIGRVFLDLHLWTHMLQAPLFVVDLPLDIRLKRLVNDYGENHMEGLEQSITNIQKRLGNQQMKLAIDALRAKDFAGAAQITLQYYDKAYDKSIAIKEGRQIIRLSFDEDNIEQIAKVLIEQAKRISK